MITREQLEKRRGIIEADLVSKLEVRDYHGVADAAMDLREIEARLTVEKTRSRWEISECHACRQRQWVTYEIMLDKTLCVACHERLMKPTSHGAQSADGDGLTLDASRAGDGFPELVI